jgi:hypothetical protein
VVEMFGNTGLGLGYTNRTQQVRMISEDWITRHAYCLRCDSDKLSQLLQTLKPETFSAKPAVMATN